MIEYTDYRGLLLDRYEWSGGFGKNDKSVTRIQAERRREVKRGSAKVVKFD
mgnify:CR=1 FL=1